MIIALLFTTMLASLALSSASSMESTVAVARDQSDTIRAELAADAAMQYARNQLANDSLWDGTGGAWIPLADSASFQVIVTMIEDNLPQSARVVVRAEGRSGNAVRALRLELMVSSGENFDGMSLMLLTSSQELELEDAKIHGDVLIPDAVGAVMDYSLDAFGNQVWALNTDPLGEREIENSQANKKIHQFTSTKWFKGKNDIVQRDSPVYMPGWNLDSYLDPAAGHWIISAEGELEDVTTNQTIVLVLAPGEEFRFKDCQIHGGIVVWAPPDYNLRDGARNYIRVESSNIGTGAAPHIGLIAPAAEVRADGPGMNFHGFNFWNSTDDFRRGHLIGILIVVNEIDEIEDVVFNSHPPTMKDPPPGIELKGAAPEIDIISGGEDLGPPPL